jgi:phosphoenolpyruvate phosphomutase
VPIAEIFRLQGEDELAAQEGLYLPAGNTAEAIILAASRGSELAELTATRPKAMVPVGGVPLLQRIVDTYRRGGVQRFTVVRGYAAAAVDLPGLTYADNPCWEQGGELASLEMGLEACDGDGDLLVSYGDVLFKRYIIEQLLDTEADWSVAVDTHWQESVNRGRDADYVHCSVPHTRASHLPGVHLRDVASSMPKDGIHGEWMGFLRVSKTRRDDLRRLVRRVLERDPRASVPSLLNALVAEGESIRVVYSTGNWLDIDSLDDLVLGGSF